MSKLSNLETKKCIMSALPFPSIHWWQEALKNKVIYLDPFEHFQKMSYRNRYYLANKLGKALQTVPLSKGRNQQLAMKDMEISFAEKWQKNHWRTLQTLMGNAPFFEYIDYQLAPFFEEKTSSLYNWNKATILWANKFLGSPLTILETDTYYKVNDPGIIDLRDVIHPKNMLQESEKYYQVFQDSAGFMADCSILDLICCEGKNALNILQDCSLNH